MVFYTPLDLDRQIMLYSDKFNLDLDGMKIGRCIEIIRENGSKLHNEEQLKELAYNNLKAIEYEYGFKALRLYIYDTCKQNLLQSFTGKDRLQEKYEKLLKEVKKFHNNHRDQELTLTLDVYLYYNLLEEVYDEEYGFLKDWNNQLYSIMKTINLTNYDENVVKSLTPYLESTLQFANGKYYLRQDLKNREVLKMLFEHIAEENMDELLVKGYNICTEYDGYGNEYWIHNYSESWHDDNGHHYRSWEPEHTIEDYIKVGLPK